MKKKIAIAIVVFVVVLVGFGSFYVYKSFAVWYTAYEGPTVSVSSEGKKTLKFNTIDRIDELCKPLQNSIQFNDVVVPFQKKIPELRALLKIIEDPPPDVQVDIFPQIHFSAFDERAKYDQDLIQMQASLKNSLMKNPYDVIGKEGRWSANVSMETMIDEEYAGLVNMQMNTEPKNSPTYRKKIESTILQFTRYDGIIQISQEKPEQAITGIEAEEVFFLHDRVNDLMRTTDNLKLRSYMMEMDQNLVWLRSEIAFAKMLTYLKARNLKRGAIVIGQNHRQQLELLAKLSQIRSGQINLIPESVRDDEAF